MKKTSIYLLTFVLICASGCTAAQKKTAKDAAYCAAQNAPAYFFAVKACMEDRAITESKKSQPPYEKKVVRNANTPTTRPSK